MTGRRRARTGRGVSKAERWLNLLAFLLNHRCPVTREEILSQVDDYRQGWVSGSERSRESVRRKFERDKRELRELGVTIEPVPARVAGEHGGQDVDAYQLKPRDLYLPYLEVSPASGRKGSSPYALPTVSLTAEEYEMLRRAARRVLALAGTPLGPSAASAYRKLAFDLPGVAPGPGEVTITAPPRPGFERVFEVVRRGVEARLAVRCRYYSIGRDAEETRVIEPYGLMLTWGHWYCIARARDRDAIRVFRLSRMAAAELLEGEEARFTVPDDFSIRHYLDRPPWELSEAPPREVRVRIAFPHSRWTLAAGLGRVVQPVDEAGGAVFAFDVRAPDAFVRWLLPFGGQAEVLAPAEIREHLEAERGRLRAVYR
ncbi:MAG TPA: WYL domain-containing protein [Gemmatimonadales bacterium]|jgi:proteasome accessory factor B|nr:WYL domain-containing protein [Gemmatimonadales bacterium]